MPSAGAGSPPFAGTLSGRSLRLPRARRPTGGREVVSEAVRFDRLRSGNVNARAAGLCCRGEWGDRRTTGAAARRGRARGGGDDALAGEGGVVTRFRGRAGCLRRVRCARTPRGGGRLSARGGGE